MNMEIPVWIIMHKGQVHKGKWFYTCEQARNWLKMNSPNRKFKEPERNTFVDTQFGSTFKVMELQYAYHDSQEVSVHGSPVEIIIQTQRTVTNKPCHTIYAGMEVYMCATTCAGLDNCELKK